jgi:hypothetical protein
VGFAVADLRSYRNVREHRVWSTRQFEAVKEWVDENRDAIDVLFFVSPVVFTHGWPNFEKAIRAFSPVSRWPMRISTRCTSAAGTTREPFWSRSTPGRPPVSS